jgi:hypothetical protein
VYEPVPPEGEELKLTDWLVFAGLGLAEQETDKTGVLGEKDTLYVT